MNQTTPTKRWWSDLPDEVLVESAWERDMFASGLDKFEQSKLTGSGGKKGASESSAGKSSVRKLLQDASQAIADMQKTVFKNNRLSRNVKGTVLIVPADTLALISLRHMIDGTYDCPDPDVGYPMQTLSTRISRAVEMELNFRNWIKESEKSAKAYAEEQGYSRIPKSFAERLIEDNGISTRTYQRWKKTFEELNNYQWDTLEKHYCGDALANSVVKGLPSVFEIHFLRKSNSTQKHIRMTPEYREKFDEKEAAIAAMQVTRKPMLAKPQQWSREE